MLNRLSAWFKRRKAERVYAAFMREWWSDLDSLEVAERSPSQAVFAEAVSEARHASGLPNWEPTK